MWTVAVGGIPTVLILSFRTDMPRQTEQTQIRLLLEEREQSDQGGAVWSGSTLFAIPSASLLYGRAISFKFKSDYNKFFGCLNI